MEIVNRIASTPDIRGYDRGSMVIAWAYDKIDKVQLLFGRVLLRPTELGRGPETRKVIAPVKLSGRAGRYVFAGVVETSASDGIGWYERALAGTWAVPSALEPNRKAPPHRTLGMALEEPVWPQLNLLVKPHPAFPCVPSSLACPRIHHRLAATPHPMNPERWTETERQEASAALAPVLGFRLADHPHLWESLRLVLPNPVLRSVGMRLVKEDGGEGLGLTLIPRRDAKLSDLRVTVWDERDSLLLPLAEFRPTESHTLLRVPGVREATGMSVDCDHLGRILVTEAHYFISQVVLTSHLNATTRHVTAERRGKPNVQYSVPVHGEPEQSVIGTPKLKGTIDLLRRARQREEERQRDSSDEEIWFSGNVDAAQARLRDLVAEAAREVWVVDYFFGAADAGILLPAIRALRAEVRVLTSREGLVAGGRPAHEAARALQNVVSKMTTELRMQPIEVRAMPGQAEIHDRFLVIDDRAYLLGSSINNYGDRGTMLVRLRGIEKVREAIAHAWRRAAPLASVATPPTETPRP